MTILHSAHLIATVFSTIYCYCYQYTVLIYLIAHCAEDVNCHSGLYWHSSCCGTVTWSLPSHAHLANHKVVLQAMHNSPGVEELQEGSVNKVQAAEAEVAELQRRVDCERQAFAQVSANLIASTSHFDLKVRLNMPKCPTKVFKAVQTRRTS